MSRFVAWNDLLLTEFFSPATENEDVWIRATRAELDSFGLHLGGAQGLVDAVRSGAPWLRGGGIANSSHAARILVEQRRDSLRLSSYQDPGASNSRYAGKNAPTYLPILALWVLAASNERLEGGFYATVEELLGRPFQNGPRVTEAMSKAWEDLEAWSTKECAGQFGNFRCRVLGEHRFVGIPRSQCLISRHDERNLHRLFWELRLRPGQSLPEATLAALLERGRNANFLTRALRAAMARDEYALPLAALLRKLLGSWDGRSPKAWGLDTERREVESSAKEYGEQGTAVTLALTPSDEVANGWDVRWAFPAMVDAPRCTLEIAGQRLPAVLHRPSVSFLTELSDFAVRQSAVALSVSAASRINVDIRFEDEGDGTWGDQCRRELIGHAVRRIMVWNSIDPRFGQQLVERDMPLYGTFYVVCSPTDWTRSESWLQREGISFEPMPPIGLPEGWRMVCIHRAEALNAEQRQHLADAAEPMQVPPARLRLVGGSRMLRGGTRIFAAYDLPDIEVESPAGSHLETPGLRVSEVQQDQLVARRSSVRRFLIEACDGGRSSFNIKVVSNGIELATVRLRVADVDGEGRGEARDFSLDFLGTPRSDLSGLRGTRVGDTLQDLSSVGWYDNEMLEAASLINEAEASFANSGAAQFLDTLASRGSMSYGAARDHLSRLPCGTNTISLLMDLRARGCLEVEADAKGHFARIHSTAPTLYGLPAKQDGLLLFGVGGTLRHAQWTLLQRNGDFFPSTQNCAAGHLPVLCLAAVDADAVQNACRIMGFQFASSPARDVANWAGSLRKAREVAESKGTESVEAELGHLHRLKADSARFIPASEPRMVIDRESGAQLFRFDDPQATALQLYVLGVRRADGACRYSHVHDSRWGVWISQLAFAEMLKNRHGRDDAFPWPLHYKPATRDVWIPARLRPPAVLERALALCSGRGPEVHFLSPGSRPGDGLSLFELRSGREVRNASLVYGEFAPGHWLRYSWVPADMASQIAGLLGCTLKPFSCLGATSGLETMTA
jgi:hypothetical protein